MKNFKKKLAEERLFQQYNRHYEFALRARTVAALSFVPIHDIHLAFEALESELPVELTPIINWFEYYYIGRQNRNGFRMNALFPPQSWSVYERTTNIEDRTNNYAETAHRKLQTEFGMDHPNIWKFIYGLRTVQKGHDLLYTQFIRGDQPPLKGRKYVASDLIIRK